VLEESQLSKAWSIALETPSQPATHQSICHEKNNIVFLIEQLLLHQQNCMKNVGLLA
jgi:hypothetical protein